MCLSVVTKRINPSIKYINQYYRKRAKKNIKVYKVVRHARNTFRSLIIGFKYVPGYHYWEEEGMEIAKFGYEIFIVRTAFHSYNLKKALEYRWGRTKIVECVIPKGSHYFQTDKCYASDNLIFTGKIISERNLKRRLKRQENGSKARNKSKRS